MNNKLFHFICFLVCATITYTAIGDYTTYVLAWVIFIAIAASCGMILYSRQEKEPAKDEIDL